MSVSISTSVYTKQITAEIDGVEFKVTPMSTAQSLSYIDLCDELREAQTDRDSGKIKEAIAKLDEILFSVFDKPDEARKVLAKVPIEGVLEIYQKIVDEKRMSGDNTFRKEKVSRVAFLLAELGMLYGWEAIVSAKRGYIEVFDEHTGKKRKIPLSMEELAVLVDAGHKVEHSDYMDYARIVCVGTGSAFSKHPEETLRRGMKPFINGVNK